MYIEAGNIIFQKATHGLLQYYTHIQLCGPTMDEGNNQVEKVTL